MVAFLKSPAETDRNLIFVVQMTKEFFEKAHGLITTVDYTVRRHLVHES